MMVLLHNTECGNKELVRALNFLASAYAAVTWQNNERFGLEDSGGELRISISCT